jgi:hypothetical protein
MSLLIIAAEQPIGLEREFDQDVTVRKDWTTQANEIAKR